MRREAEQVLLRVWVVSSDRAGWLSPPVAEVLLERARQAGLSGGTVFEGIHGLASDGELLGERSVFSLARPVPAIVELIDEAPAIGAFLPRVAEVVRRGLATLERTHVLVFRKNGDGARLPPHVPAAIEPLSTLPSPEEFPAMKESETGQLLRVFIGESDTHAGQPLYRAVVLKAKELGLAGATVLRGPMGFGANSRLHTTKLLELSTDLPLVIEIVDAAEKVEQLLPWLDEVVKEGLITIEAVRVLRYRADPGKRRT